MTLCLHCLGSLANNDLCGYHAYGRDIYTTEGINALCDALKGNNTLTSLKYAGYLESIPTNALTARDMHVCPPLQP